MTENESKIGKAFKEKFEDFSEMPNPKVWERVKTSIPKNKLGNFKYILIAALVCVAVAAGFFFTTKKETPSHNNLPQKSNDAQIVDTLKNNAALYPKNEPNYYLNAFFWNKEKSVDTVVPLPIPFISPEKAAAFVAKKVEPAFTGEYKEVDSVLSEIKNEDNESSVLLPIEASASTPQHSLIEEKKILLNNSEKLATQEKLDSKSSIKSELLEQKELKSMPAVTISANSNTNPIVPHEVKNHSFEIMLPSAFTPGEQTNNIFTAIVKDVSQYEMHIYNRNGEQIFKSKDVNRGWDGNIKGTEAPSGAYIYFVRCVNSNGITTEKRGTINLIR